MSNNSNNNNNNNNDNNNQDPSTSNGINSNSNSRPIFTLTMDPNALEHEIDQATQALHSTVNSLLNTMQSSVFGGLEHLSREMSALEKTSRTYLEENPLEKMVEKHVGHHAFPWSLKTDGPKKRYRITIEELPPLTEAEIQEQKDVRKVLSTTTSGAGGNGVEMHDGEDFTITQGKVGTVDEGKTVITAAVAPGLLDWLLFTTHEDSFFRRLGSGAGTPDNYGQGPTIQELKDETAVTNAAVAEEGQKGGSGRLPVLVEKVKRVGTSWEKDARHWWQGKRSNDGQSETLPPSSASSSSSAVATDQQHHLFSGTSQSEQDQEEERLSHRWPRNRSWERSESFSQTTVTRPDGTVEHRTVNTLNGETETVVKIQHPDGSIEETVTRQGNDHGRRDGRQRLFQWNNGQGRNEEYEDDRERDVIAAVVAEAISTEKAAEFEKQQQQQREQQEGSGRSWPPKAWSRRQGRDE
ncbi:hypothetical protein BGZ96_001780 [Linnemannia gamsii]|uniref:Uncharacterized protein n=1 Tax=Linnemannia gamsii TaxID=64522 RepID=A0ABQ7JLZ6_9FUNG|nr:hypothetical protein BGZ96_001780 [Linnemannia gamsii]